MNLYTFQWVGRPDVQLIEVLSHNAGSAWLKACDISGAFTDDLVLLYVAEGYQA